MSAPHVEAPMPVLVVGPGSEGLAQALAQLLSAKGRCDLVFVRGLRDGGASG